MERTTLPEILLVDKGKGMTSFDVIRILKRNIKAGILHAPEQEISAGMTAPKNVKIGHAGTLDPLATGLMLVGIGAGTKKLTELIGLDKEYIAEIRVGESRTTGDMEGVIVEEREVEEIFSEEKISSILTAMLGTLRLPVSAYSAMKKGGVPMYKRARAAEQTGEVITDVPIRDMEIFEVELLNIKNTIIDDSKRFVAEVRFKVGSGTYIRSLAGEFGKRLGYPATLQSLRRTKVGDFDIKDAITLHKK